MPWCGTYIQKDVVLHWLGGVGLAVGGCGGREKGSAEDPVACTYLPDDIGTDAE